MSHLYISFPWTIGASILALFVMSWLTMRVGAARGKYNVTAPATTGHPLFERHYRIQMNSVEQFVMFLPALWLFAAAWGDVYAGLLGAMWSLGRVIYAISYAQAPEKRGPGMMIGFLALIALLGGALIKWAMALAG